MQSLLHLGKVSSTALAEILSIARQQPVNRSTLDRANKSHFMEVRKVLVLPKIGGGEVSWEVFDFAKTLNLMLRLSPGLQELYEVTLQKFPHRHKLSLCAAFDEFVPGNKLQAANWMP